MQCNSAEKIIELLIDNEIDLQLKRNLEEHLKLCQNCEKILKQKRLLRKTLKKNFPLVKPSDHLQKRLMENFQFKQDEFKPTGTLIDKSAFFQGLRLARLSFALFPILIIGLLGVGFQLGKIYSTSIEVSMPVENLDTQIKQSIKTSSSEKVIKIPVTKIVKVPIIKERVVTRYIYRIPQNNKREKVKTFKAKSQIDKNNLDNFTGENRSFTQTKLKDFKPVKEIKAKLVKGGRSNEK